MYTEVAKNKRNSWFLMFLFVLIVVALGWVFSKALGNSAILYVATAFAVVYAWVSYYYSDRIVLAVSNAREITKDQAPEFYRVVENMAMTAGLPMPKVFIIEDSAPNAFATGRDPQHAAVAATTGILQKLTKPELEGVIAHELSHVGNYDIRFMALVSVMVSIIALLSDWFLRFSFFGGRSRGNRDNESGQLGMILMVVGIVLAILTPIIGSLLQLAVSRRREYLADASGALLSRNPLGLAHALAKLEEDTEPLEVANKATASLYIVNPLRANVEGGGGFVAGLFSTHPPIAERIKRLQAMEGKV